MLLSKLFFKPIKWYGGSDAYKLGRAVTAIVKSGCKVHSLRITLDGIEVTIVVTSADETSSFDSTVRVYESDIQKVLDVIYV